ncbi:MAG: CCDC90 family protein [Acetobacteraceae bacterium]|nr:CCDC90 family protein [Acetobacteraceae bacterium]
MAVVALDTHAVVKELQAAGFSEAQAEAVTRAVRRAQDLDLSNLATKSDIQALKTDFQVLKTEIDGLRTSTKADIDSLRASTKADNDSLRASTKADISELKADILKWMVGAIGVQTIAILGALVGLARVLKG